MVEKARSPDQTAVTISLAKADLEQLDIRASALGLSRSKYLTLLALRDIEVGGDLVLRPTNSKNPAGPDASGGAVMLVAGASLNESLPAPTPPPPRSQQPSSPARVRYKRPPNGPKRST